jgi:hypothetical protein
MRLARIAIERIEHDGTGAEQAQLSVPGPKFGTFTPIRTGQRLPSQPAVWLTFAGRVLMLGSMVIGRPSPWLTRRTLWRACGRRPYRPALVSFLVIPAVVPPGTTSGSLGAPSGEAAGGH